jgi:DNA-binding beta-propeller fold protein YncE
MARLTLEEAMRIRSIPALSLIVALAAFTGGLALQAQSGLYTKIGEIPIGGTIVSFDYLNVDSAAKRLYVTNSTGVYVIDLAASKVITRIAGGTRVHGIALGPNNRGFMTNGGEGTVQIVDLKTFETLGKVETGAGSNPDAILYEPKNKEVYALNHSGKSATVFEAATGKVVATIPLAGLAETGQADPELGRVFVNIEDTNSVDVIDIATHKVIANWPVAPAESNTGMAIDLATHRIFVGGGPATVMMDARTGKVIASAPIVPGTDATWFDPGTKMVFSSGTGNGGAITAMKVDGDKLTVVQTIPTVRGARTMALDPATHNLYVVGQKYAPVDPNAPAPAAGQKGGRGTPAIPDSFHVLVFGMNK